MVHELTYDKMSRFGMYSQNNLKTIAYKTQRIQPI